MNGATTERVNNMNINKLIQTGLNNNPQLTEDERAQHIRNAYISAYHTITKPMNQAQYIAMTKAVNTMGVK